MYDGAVADVPVTSDNEVKTRQAVQRTIVLHVAALFKYDATEIAAQRCARPHITSGTNHHIANDDSVGVYEGR